MDEKPVHPLVRKLESIFTLSDEEKAALEAMPMQIVNLRADQDIVREGDRPTRSCLLLEGFSCFFKMTGDGNRQIMAFSLPGDIPDLLSLHLDVMDNSLGTLTPCKVGFIQHEILRNLSTRFPKIASAFWRDTLIDASIFREWVLNIGQREAYSRLAHLLCEFIVRSRAVGLGNGSTYYIPMTQTELGDAMGISTVHANRVIQQLRSDGLVSWSGTKLTVRDWDGLKSAGDFDPTYLHLKRTEGTLPDRGDA
jgi:CRP-like cAMP-binding protein